MPTFYHATSASNERSIDLHGFRAGSGGHDGPGIYFCKRPEAAINRARLPRGEGCVVYACDIPHHSVTNVNNQDNFKVDAGDRGEIRRMHTTRYSGAEVLGTGRRFGGCTTRYSGAEVLGTGRRFGGCTPRGTAAPRSPGCRRDHVAVPERARNRSRDLGHSSTYRPVVRPTSPIYRRPIYSRLSSNSPVRYEPPKRYEPPQRGFLDRLYTAFCGRCLGLLFGGLTKGRISSEFSEGSADSTWERIFSELDRRTGGSICRNGIRSQDWVELHRRTKTAEPV